jgi:ribosomal protein L39E
MSNSVISRNLKKIVDAFKPSTRTTKLQRPNQRLPPFITIVLKTTMDLRHSQKRRAIFLTHSSTDSPRSLYKNDPQSRVSSAKLHVLHSATDYYHASTTPILLLRLVSQITTVSAHMEDYQQTKVQSFPSECTSSYFSTWLDGL